MRLAVLGAEGQNNIPLTFELFKEIVSSDNFLIFQFESEQFKLYLNTTVQNSGHYFTFTSLTVPTTWSCNPVRCGACTLNAVVLVEPVPSST